MWYLSLQQSSRQCFFTFWLENPIFLKKTQRICHFLNLVRLVNYTKNCWLEWTAPEPIFWRTLWIEFLMNGKVVRFVTFAIYHSLYLGSSGRLHVRFPLWVLFQSVNVDGYMSYFVFLLPFQLRFLLRFFWVGCSLLLTFIPGTYDQSFDQLWFYVPQNCFSEAIVQLRLFALYFQFIEILSTTWGTFWFILYVIFLMLKTLHAFLVSI